MGTWRGWLLWSKHHSSNVSQRKTGVVGQDARICRLGKEKMKLFLMVSIISKYKARSDILDRGSDRRLRREGKAWHGHFRE